MRSGWLLRAWETSRLRIAWGQKAITSFNLQLTNSQTFTSFTTNPDYKIHRTQANVTFILINYCYGGYS